MAKSKANDSDRKAKKKLRRSWIENHPDVRAANNAIVDAQKQIHEPKWIADPAAYCASVGDAAGRVKQAKAKLKETVDRLKGEFDRATGLDGGTSPAE
jgi:hypothetical protein